MKRKSDRVETIEECAAYLDHKGEHEHAQMLMDLLFGHAWEWRASPNGTALPRLPYRSTEPPK